jgi:hypothetical protein
VKSKDIRFDYFQVIAREYDEDNDIVNEKLFNLDKVLTAAVKADVCDRVFKHYDDEARLQVVEQKKYKIKPLWKLQFLRIRKSYVPGIATDEGDFDPLDLEENEGVGEDVTVIYDNLLCVMLVQRNRDGLSPSGIADYFNNVLGKPGLLVLKPILLPDEYMKMSKDNIFRSVHISFADLKTDSIPTSGSLSKILGGIGDYKAISVDLTLSLGRRGKKAQSLSVDQVLNTIDVLKDNPEVTKLEIKKKENEDCKVETFDLVEERLHELAAFTYSREKPIQHEDVYKKMARMYFDRKEALQKILKS